MPETTLLAPSARYHEGVVAHRWEADPTQLAMLPEFDRLHAALSVSAEPGSGLFDRLRSLLGAESAPAIPGLYLWGTVGRGKTFLMDLFAASLPHGVALRRHFHRFMSEVHDSLRALGERQDPLVEVAAQLALRCRVLCLDEFLVNDIGDAMILANLLDALFARNVVLVTTSNTPPTQLYAGGLQRARFLPAIALLEQRCHVRLMESTHDWRLRALTQSPVYLTPPGAEAQRALERIFTSQASGVTSRWSGAPTTSCGSTLPRSATVHARLPTTLRWPRPARPSSSPTCHSSPWTAKTRPSASCNWWTSSTTTASSWCCPRPHPSPSCTKASGCGPPSDAPNRA